MRKYNIYYNNTKLNQRALTKEEVNMLLNNQYIYKKDDDKENNSTYKKINTKSLEIVESIIIS